MLGPGAESAPALAQPDESIAPAVSSSASRNGLRTEARRRELIGWCGLGPARPEAVQASSSSGRRAQGEQAEPEHSEAGERQRKCGAPGVRKRRGCYLRLRCCRSGRLGGGQHCRRGQRWHGVWVCGTTTVQAPSAPVRGCRARSRSDRQWSRRSPCRAPPEAAGGVHRRHVQRCAGCDHGVRGTAGKVGCHGPKPDLARVGQRPVDERAASGRVATARTLGCGARHQLWRHRSAIRDS